MAIHEKYPRLRLLIMLIADWETRVRLIVAKLLITDRQGCHSSGAFPIPSQSPRGLLLVMHSLRAGPSEPQGSTRRHGHASASPKSRLWTDEVTF